MDEPYVVNVDCAVVEDGEYLLIERAASEGHAGGTLASPGGTVDDPPADVDPVVATARRELREEVGLAVGAVDYVTSRTFETDDGTRVLNVVVRCERVGGEARVAAPDEVAAVEWLSPAALRARDPPAYLLDYLDHVAAARAD